MLKINNVSNISFTSKNDENNTVIISDIETNNPEIDSKSLDIIEQINRTMMNMPSSVKDWADFLKINNSNIMNEEEINLKNKCLEQIKKDFKGFAELRRWSITKANVNLTNKILFDERLHGNKDFYEFDALYSLIDKTQTKEQEKIKLELLDNILSEEKLYNNKLFMKNAGSLVADCNNEYSKNILLKIMKNDYLLNNKEFLSGIASELVQATGSKEQEKVAEEIITNDKIYKNHDYLFKLSFAVEDCKSIEQYDLLFEVMNRDDLLKNENFLDEIGAFTDECNTPEKIEAAKKIISNKTLLNNEKFIKFAYYFLSKCDTKEKVEIALKMLDNEKLYSDESFMENSSIFIEECDTKEKAEIANKLLSNQNIIDNADFMQNVIRWLSGCENYNQIYIANKILDNEKLCASKEFMKDSEFLIMYAHNYDFAEITEKMLDDKRLYSDKIITDNAVRIICFSYTEPLMAFNLSLLEDEDFSPAQAVCIIDGTNDTGIEKIEKLNNTIGKEKAHKLSVNDTQLAVLYTDFHNKNDINNLSQKEKKELLHALISTNDTLTDVSDDMKTLFPIFPKNAEEYSDMISLIVNSLEIETKILDNKEINKFYKNINELVLMLPYISDEKFKNIEITQEYSKNEFIGDVLKKIKKLPFEEQQKVYDYFGFELYENKNTNFKIKGKGYSITGYPSLNNKKHEQITNNKTIKVLEAVRNDVKKFTQNNKIKVKFPNNKSIEQEIAFEEKLNNIISVLPELRTSIGNVQHGKHQFDVFQHSLKVMQEIVKNPEYQNLNASDKKIMLLAALLHDITKTEGQEDINHADNSSFDTFFISKKFGLNKEEEIKLFNLIKHHEWLKYVNSQRIQDENELTERLQSVAYDLRHDNLFDMALIFTHVDLKGVNDTFHDIKNNKRKNFKGEIRSFGEAADYHGAKIKEYINELKKSQPLLPVTKIPKASKINKAIIANADGSTNIKGVYKDKDGLIIIKYNELENNDLWKIGFPDGSCVKGIKNKTSKGENVDTGNIKFFAHGLDYLNQLAKFDALSLVDSDVLLSVSYAERPESKSRFYRTQGILLDCDTKYIHGGGETDSGSGCGKFISEFKQNYIFGGEREKDRTYISDLIKETLKLNDEEYMQFVKNNENKSMLEIEPEEIREKIIRAFSEINSNIRIGQREYNEMYISNPNPPMAVYAYSEDENEQIYNPVEFLNRTERNKKESVSVAQRTDFLRKYALDNDLPFIIFGE